MSPSAATSLRTACGSTRGASSSGSSPPRTARRSDAFATARSRKTSSTRSGSVRSEEHTSELQSLMRISYAVFCLKKKKQNNITNNIAQKTKEHTNQKKYLRHDLIQYRNT